MGRNTRSAICDRLKSKSFSQGETIVNKGSTAEFLYFVVKGRVIFEKNNSKVELGPYNLIGEMELMRSIDATHKIIAKTNLECLILSKYDFDILAFKNRLKEQYNFKEKLKQMKCFCNWRISKIEQLCASMTIAQYSITETIFDVHSSASFFYYIKKGSVVVDLHVTMQKKNNWPVGKKM